MSVAAAGVLRIERDVIGDQELAGADDRGPALGIEGGRAAIGLPRRVLQLCRQALIFAAADVGQVPSPGIAGGRFVEIDADAQFVAHPPADAMGHRRRNPPA